MPLPISIVSNPGVTTGGGGGVTLDGAYDFGGPGAGRTIIADAGAVEVVGELLFGSLANIPFSFGVVPIAGGIHEVVNTALPAFTQTIIFNSETAIDLPADAGAFAQVYANVTLLRHVGPKSIYGVFGDFSDTYSEGSGDISLLVSLQGFAYAFGTSDIDTIIATQGYAEIDSGTTALMIGLEGTVVTWGGDTIDQIAVRARPLFFAGTLVNQYGLKVEDVAGATNNWAIHTGMGLVEFGDDTIVNGKLTVTGAIDPVSVLLSDPAAGTALFYESNDGQTAPVSGAATGRLRYNNATGKWEQSVQGGAYSALVGFALLSIYGDGSDGVVVLPAGITTLARDMYYQDLTVPVGSTLETKNFRVRVRGTCTIDGTVSCNGVVGGNGSGVAGGVGGAAGGAGLATLQPGATGAGGGFGVGGGTAPSRSDCLGGQGGNGGAAGLNPGGSGGTATPPTVGEGGPKPLKSFINALAYVLTDSGFFGDVIETGTAGGGGGGALGGGGGGGGGPGGNIYLFAQTFAGAGAVQAKGGGGGSAGGAGGGGGGGGGGGIILTMSQNSPGAITFDVLGGAGGLALGGGNVNGTAGAAGTVENLVNT